MANNVNNRIGCAAGKTTIIDPNNFDGHDSSSNISVPLEDLNISVVLRTFRKGRTVLTDDGDANTRESSKTVEINFIEGSDINGTKSLTTKFTDLTVVGDSEFNDETLGITSIDIDFNSSYAPMININFIDVRGSSIFQNEENISGNNTNNKYAVFFQLPYPLFELEIKGYYGKPVTYCLHMLKFTSKFNSKTGNFEIQCQFVGYTYAMLSDMLIGYLKAISFTKIGEEKYEKYNSTKQDKVLTLTELMLKISKINEGVEKIASNSENSKLVNTATEANDELDAITNIINALGSGLDYDNKTIKDKYTYVIKLSQPLTEIQKNVIDLYKKNIEAAITKFNELNAGASLSIDEFKSFDITGVNKGFYSGISQGDLDPTKSNNDTVLSQKLGSPKDLTKLKKDIFNYLKSNYTIADNLLIDVYNLDLLFTKIDDARASVNNSGAKAKEDLAIELKDKVAETLGFQPTVRRIVEIFTAAIEVFMETIYDVSRAAEATDNTERQTQLEKKFTVDLLSVDSKKEYIDNKKFFPWPDYREKDEKTNSYVEKYLGSAGVLEQPKDVNELVFIDDLLAGFIKAKKASDEAQTNEESGPILWFPSNPLDSNVFIETEPYTRTEILDYSDITRLMVIRGMTFLGYSNDASILTEAEVIGMGLIEADAILRNLKDDKIKQTLTYLDLDFIKKITGFINGVERPVIKYGDKVDGKTVTPFYYYDYIFKSNNNPDTHKLIPISQGFNKAQWGDGTSESKLKELASDENVFLTNYSDAYANSNDDKFVKKDDGGIYVKILKPEEFTSKLGTLVAPPSGITTESKFILSKLQSDTVGPDAGYNSFGGNLGVQEYLNMDFGEPGVELPLMYVFYKDFDNGLAFNRKNSGIEQKTSKNAPTVSKYDLNPKSITKLVIGSKDNAYKSATDSFYVHTNLGKNRALFSSYLKGDKEITYPYIELRIMGDNFGEIRDPYKTGTFSLFGSKFYYLQDLSKITLNNGTKISGEKYSKAFLFLHTLPFNLEKGWSHDPFAPNEIIHLFDKKAGFIHAPRLWCSYIGSILWWLDVSDPKLDDDNQIVGGGRGKNDPIIYRKNCVGGEFQEADPFEYFPKVLDIIGDLVEQDATLAIMDKSAKIQKTDVISKLPSQVKNEFKRIFFEFVNGTDGMVSFDDIKQKLEIWSNTSASFCNFVGTLHAKKAENSNDEFFVNSSLITTNSNVMNLDSYSVITPLYLNRTLDYERNNHLDYLFLELKGDYTTNPAVTTLIDALTQEVVIANTNYKIWGDGNKILDNDSSTRITEYESIYVDKPIFDLYFNTIINRLKEAGDTYSPTAEKKQALQEIFGTANEDTIKLQLYRTCKNIHDKWLAGTIDPNNIIFQCGSGRNKVDSLLAKQYNNTTTRLIDSFRFVTRSFRDLGDDLYINPLPINDYLIENQNTSSYDAISSMLASNNFDFVALPSFINFKDPQELESLFKPYGNYGEAISEGSCGPSFVCVYVGQKSKHLDFKNSQFPSDSFDFRCDNGNLDVSVPQDFTTNSAEYEDPVAVFTVKYGQQNQNIFKDIELDQSEFTETDESIQIQEDISQKGSETNRTIAGQNLYNVYAVRSYTAEVEMMGNAMIQPMMYFQLDNIPMFHGAYMITRVKHAIKPNNMSTSFTGVRIKVSETPLIDAMDLYMSFIDSLDTSAAGTGGSGGGGGGGNPRGSLSPLTMTIYENGGLNGKIIAGNIKTKAIPKVQGINNLKINNKAENQLLAEAVDPLVKMLNAWIVWQKANGFKGNGGNYGIITSVFRDYDKQVAVKKEYGSGAATPGSSPHGWGVAVDFQFYKKDGTQIGNTKNTASSFNSSNNPALKWLLDNSYVYGWVLPYSLRDQVGLDEHWHFEYHGTAAKCLMEKNPTTYGFKTDTSKTQDSSVLNPLTKEGKRAVYTSCDYKAVKDVGDGTEKSTTLTDAEAKDNQKKTKVFLKSKGYTKQQVAGIMGNIQQESRFNPSALNKKDLNGYASFGLIQWNEKYTTRAEAGATLDAQLNHLIGMGTFKKWANLSEPKTSVEESTFQFAKVVEICHKCNKDFQTYKDSYQYVRTQFANDFFKRFNDKNDPLAW